MNYYFFGTTSQGIGIFMPYFIKVHQQVSSSGTRTSHGVPVSLWAKRGVLSSAGSLAQTEWICSVCGDVKRKAGVQSTLSAVVKRKPVA